MKRTNKLQLTACILLLLAIVLMPLLTTTAWAAGYDYYAVVTIESDEVKDDHVNFPILISGTYDGTAGEPDIRTTGNGGNIENTDAAGGITGSLTVPADLVFSPNTDGSSPFDFEYLDYDAATGDIIAWVEIPTMDASDDLVIYMTYGDNSVTTTQEDINNTWTSYTAVYHLNNQLKDSSGNLSDLSEGGTPTGSASGGMVLGYYEFTGGGSDYLEVAEAPFSIEPWTLEALFYPTTLTQQNPILFIGDADKNDHHISINADGSEDDVGLYQGDYGGAAGEWAYSTANYTEDAWNYGASTMATATDKRAFVNGGNKGTNVVDLGSIHDVDTLSVGSRRDSTPSYVGATIRVEEIRVSDDAKSDLWIETTYNTFTPGTFYTMGAEQSPTPTVTPTPTDTPTPTATPAWYTCDPSVVIDQDLQDEVAAALVGDIPNEDANCWAITDIYTVGDYSMISLAGLEADEPVDWNDWTFQDALWTGTAIIRDNGDTTYTTGLDEDATYLTLLGESSFSDPNDGADQGGGGGNWIWFPWLAGTQGFYGSRGVHRASVALPGWVAVDIVGGVNYGDTTFPNMVYGSYTEPIKSICRDGTAVGLTTENYYYLHLEESTSFQPGLLIRQGQPVGSLVMGSFNDKCGWAGQNATSYHLHWGFKPALDYKTIENWVLNIDDEIWRNGGQSVDIGGSILAEWPDHSGPIPTAGPSVTPGGPTPTPGSAPPVPRVYGGDSLWDPFIYGLYDMAQVTANRFPEHTASGIGSQITSGAEIAIRVAFVMLTSNFDLTISIIIFGLIAAAEIVRLIYAIYLGVKKLIPLLG